MAYCLDIIVYDGKYLIDPYLIDYNDKILHIIDCAISKIAIEYCCKLDFGTIEKFW